MALTPIEGLRNGANLLTALADASEVDSDGGSKITISEIGGILSTIGITLVQDILDNEPEAPVEPE